ncbi:GAF domain-containing protein [Bordetella petrii]|uniref:GAF domain-containing protein n=1 Tax=Bordetella petrii (strain ATCC BAA-461 / DSM 12804 / CCUG 43448 / CIP 107267 / Se-1111R) TaxID=340100 RepID=A9IDP7_BORPD|nr:GAF domain-containing protein [Bordetella petrii]CAP41585.1 hypothetical protein predicted by Glimmer/Critica [Bordetella petrii]
MQMDRVGGSRSRTRNVDEGAVLNAQQADYLISRLSHAGDFASFMGRLDQVREDRLGPGQLTVNANTTSHRVKPPYMLQRLWSSLPAHDPVGGEKQKDDTAWTRQVLQDGELFIGNGDQAIADAFSDHAMIQGRGLHAIVNIPVCQQKRCIATLNVLTARQRWADEEIQFIRLLALLAHGWIVRECSQLPSTQNVGHSGT